MEVVKLLLTEGNAEVDKTNNNGYTPLWIAAQLGKTEVVKLLLRGGADKNKARNDGDTPLIIAAYFGKIDAVRLLLEAKADVSIRGDGSKTALEWAKKRGHQAIVALLEQ